MQQHTLNFSAWDISYFAVLMTVGTACHFAYQALGKPFIAGLVFPTNESTFQHLKMLILPSTLFFFIQFFTTETQNQGFLLSRFFGLLIGMLAICVFFYTYSGIVGDNFIIMDILSFTFGVFCTIFASRLFDDSCIFDFPFSNAIGALALLITLTLGGVFTLYPPKIGLFLDPVTSSYPPLKA